ncbi:MAG: HAD-IA family hydrolase [Hyphomicrobiaceae bacterium]
MRDLTIAFDLDGTLVETAPDLIRATNHVLGLIGEAPVAAAEIRPSISFGGRGMILKALEIKKARLSPAEIDHLLEHFLGHYEANIAAESHAFPGLEAALDALSAEGARLVVCTNKREAPSRLLLETLGLAHRFAAIAGRDTFPVYKPHPDHLTGVVRLAGGDPHFAVMVGDSATDLQTARAAGVPMIGVPFGYTDVPMRDLGPDVLLEHYDQLFATVAQVRPPRHT